MTIVGHQQFMRAGSRFYYQREGSGNPFIDMGIISTITPGFDIQKSELRDPDNGVNALVDESVNQFDETYELTTPNLNNRNLSLLFLGAEPETFTQASQEVAVSHTLIPKNLVKIVDGANDLVFGLTSVTGIHTGTLTSYVVTDIVKSTGVVSVDDATGLSPDDVFMIGFAGLVDPANAGTYKIESIATNDLTLYAESRARLSADETSITGVGYGENAGTIYEYGADWIISNLERGFAKIVDGGAISTETTATITYVTKSITGERLFYPQSGDETRGRGFFVIGADRGAVQLARVIPSLSITPSGMNLDATDYSNLVLSVKVLSDPSDPQSAGKVIQWRGDLVASA